MRRDLARYTLALATVCISCRPPRSATVRELSDRDWIVVHRVPEGIFTMTSSADGGSAAVFWSFDNDLLIIDGSRFLPVRLTGFRQVRGAVAVGHTIYVGGLLRGEDQEVVVRLR